MGLSKICRDLTAITMGIDHFERSVNDGRSLLDGESLVPIYMGDDLVPPRPYENWEAVQDDLRDLGKAMDTLAEGERKTYLKGMLTSLKVAVRIFSGGSPTFEEKVTDLVGAPRGREDKAVIEGARDSVDRLLNQEGFRTGSLKGRVQAWEDARAVATDRIAEVFVNLMAEARRRTNDMIFDAATIRWLSTPYRECHVRRVAISTKARWT